jgi:hypothetical protein
MVGESLSPRRRWMRDHGIAVLEPTGAGGRCAAYRGGLFAAIGTQNIAYADDEYEAVLKLAGQCALATWHADPCYTRAIFRLGERMTASDLASIKLTRRLRGRRHG